MNLLSLLDIGIVLSDAAQCKFIHKINFMWNVHMFILFWDSIGVTEEMVNDDAP